MSDRSDRIIHGPVGKTLVDLTAPMILGVLGMIAFNLIDTYFIGQLGTRQLAAISFTFPVIMIISSFAQGIGIGVVSLVSNAIGQGQRDRAARETTDSLLLAMVIVLIFSVAGYFTITPLFGLLGATDQTLPYIRDYMEIWYVAVVFLVVPMVGNNAIRAAGDTKTPSFIMLAAVAVNAVLDPLLIFGYGPFPELGIEGAALATAISRATTLAVALYVLYFREKLLVLKLGTPQEFWGCIRGVMRIGFPAAGARMINPLGITLITGILSGFGPAAVAAYGVAVRIEMFGTSVINALSSVIGPFVGQNLGARQYDRIQRSFRLSYRFSWGWGLGVAALFALLARPVASAFTDNADVIQYVQRYLYIVPVSYGLQGIFLIGTTSLNTLQKPLWAAALSVLQMLVIAVPLAYLASQWLDVWAVFASISVAYVIAGLAVQWVNRRALQQAQSVPVADGSSVATSAK